MAIRLMGIGADGSVLGERVNLFIVINYTRHNCHAACMHVDVRRAVARFRGALERGEGRKLLGRAVIKV